MKTLDDARIPNGVLREIMMSTTNSMIIHSTTVISEKPVRKTVRIMGNLIKITAATMI